MTILARHADLWYSVNPLRVFLFSVLIPAILGIPFWLSVNYSVESQRKSQWITLRRRIYVFFLIETAALWAFWEFYRLPRPPSLWSALVVGVAVVQLTCYCLDRTFLERRWTVGDVVKLTFWCTVSPTVALVLVANGFDAIYDHSPMAILWLVAAAIVARGGDIGLRFAEGMKLHEVKSGPAYKRAFVLAKDMGTRLKRVYIVPAGRGHMTNAFGLSRSIALTDNYGKFLHGPHLDFVIVHELAHVKQRHGRKELVTTVAIYGSLGILILVIPPGPSAFRPLFDLVVLLGPVLALRYMSRRYEYEADRVAVELTQDAAGGIKALASLYRITQTPANFSWAAELFMTHPSLKNRARAIGEIGRLSGEQIANAVTEAGGSEVILG